MNPHSQYMAACVGVAFISFSGVFSVSCQESQDTKPGPSQEETAARLDPAPATDDLEPYQCGTLAPLHAQGKTLLAGQPSPEDLAEARKRGVTTVINLRHPEETPDMDEKQVAESLGLTYFNPAWNGPEELTDEKFDEVRGLLKAAKGPVLFHCGSSNRVGPLWMAHRVLDEGVDVEAAAAEAKAAGMRTSAYEEIARDYIRRKQDSSGKKP